MKPLLVVLAPAGSLQQGLGTCCTPLPSQPGIWGRAAVFPLAEHRDLIHVEGKFRELVESVCRRGAAKGPSVMQLLRLKQLERSKTMFL